MPENKLSTANPAQAEAIRHRAGPALILAGPGSGKTYTIVQRILYLIEEGGADPASILVITFTKAAADEMKERFRREAGGKSYPVNFGTFHAVYYHILKNAYHYQSGTILSESEKRELLKIILLRPGCPIEPREEIIEEILARISLCKNEGGGPGRMQNGDLGAKCVQAAGMQATGQEPGGLLTQEIFWQIFTAYQKELRRAGKLDFDDMAPDCLALFRSYPKVLEAWQEKYHYILVDEFQDINSVQYEVLRLLALPENNLFVVGDDDQSIYSFRGARPDIMLGFQKDYPESRQIELAVNYRSTQEIVSCAGKLIAANRNRFSKKAKAAAGHGAPVCFCGYADREEQNRVIAEAVRKDREKGEACAVLFRTGQDAAELAGVLAECGIPFWMKERIRSPYRTQTVQELLAYLSFAEKEGRGDFYRIMNKPVRYLSRDAVEGQKVDFGELFHYYRDRPYMQAILRRFQMDMARIRRMDLFAAVNYIRKGVGYEEYLKKKAGEQGKEANELLEEAEWFQRQVKAYPNLEVLREHITVFERELEKASAEKTGEECVSLLTMHASKGLEYDNVYIPDCNEGVIPHRKSMAGSQVEEERRMLYVAMTRARKRLMLTWVEGGRSMQKEPGFRSRFLSDLGI